MSRFFPGLQGQLITAFLLTLAVSFVVLIIVFGVVINDYEQGTTVQRLDATAIQTALFLSQASRSGQYTSAQALLDANGSSLASGDAVLLLSNQLVIGEHNLNPGVLGDPFQPTRPTLVRPPGGGTVQSGQLTIGGQTYDEASVPVMGRSALRRLLVDHIAVLGAPNKLVSQGTRDLLGRFLLAAMASLAVAIIIAVLFARGIAQPLHQITRAAEGVAVGEFDRPLPTDGRDEIAQLAQAFADMRLQIQRNEQMQRELIANVSHELRSPLTSIRGFSEAMLDGSLRDPTSVARAAEIIRKESERLVRLTSDLLDLARLQSGNLALHRTDADIRDVVTQAVQARQETARQSGHGIALHLPDWPVNANIDPDRTIQIVGNLIDNALKFGAPGSVITVGVSGQGAPRFEVTNQGPTLSLEEQQRIFDRFYQMDSARTRGNGGAGLGLAIVRELASAQGGHIAVDSQDGWTTFSVTLRAGLSP